MNADADNIIGIIGGMGPQAGVSLLNEITAQTKSLNDQGHLSSILISLPKHIQDRTRFLEGEVTENPAFAIVEIIIRVESIGAKTIGIACNTCHVPIIYQTITRLLIQKKSKVKLLNMPHEVLKYLRQQFPEAKKIGIMATNGTYKFGLYQNLLLSNGFNPVVPDSIFQSTVIHELIYNPQFGIKSNPDVITHQAYQLINKAFSFFEQEKVDVVILACTELSLIPVLGLDLSFTILDSSKIMAGALIREATWAEDTEKDFVKVKSNHK